MSGQVPRERGLAGRRRGPVPSRVALLAALALPACRVPPPDLSADPAELLGAVRARQEQLRRASGSAWLSIDGPGARGGIAALATAEKPDRLRVDLLDFFGTPALSLSAAGGRFVLFDGRSGRWMRGPATPEALGSLLPGAPPVEALVAALCGSATLLDGTPLAAAPGPGLRLLRVSAGPREQLLEVGAGAAVLAARTVRRRVGGGTEAEGSELRFGLFRRIGAVRFPSEVRLADPAGTSLMVRWGDDLELNGPADPIPFSLAPPPGAHVEEWTGGAAPRLDLPLRPRE